MALKKGKQLEAPLLGGGASKTAVKAAIRAAKTTKVMTRLKRAAEAAGVKTQWTNKSKALLRKKGLGAAKERRHKPPKGGHPF